MVPTRAHRHRWGLSRREMLRAGGLGLFGLGLDDVWRARVHAAAGGAAEVGDPGVLPGGPEPHRHLGPEAGRPLAGPRRVRHHRHEDPGPPRLRTPPRAGRALGPVLADPLDDPRRAGARAGEPRHARRAPQGAGERHRAGQPVHRLAQPRVRLRLRPPRPARPADGRRPPHQAHLRGLLLPRPERRVPRRPVRPLARRGRPERPGLPAPLARPPRGPEPLPPRRPRRPPGRGRRPPPRARTGGRGGPARRLPAQGRGPPGVTTGPRRLRPRPRRPQAPRPLRPPPHGPGPPPGPPPRRGRGGPRPGQPRAS